YPCEWPSVLLYRGAELTLELALELGRAGLGLKDADPLNILYDGCRPVFVDLLSIERREPRDAIWRPYAQFVRNFLFPLILERELGLPANDILRFRPGGPEPLEMYQMLPWRRRLAPAYLESISLPVWLSRRRNSEEIDYSDRLATTTDKAKHILLST